MDRFLARRFIGEALARTDYLTAPASVEFAVVGADPLVALL